MTNQEMQIKFFQHQALVTCLDQANGVVAELNRSINNTLSILLELGLSEEEITNALSIMVSKKEAKLQEIEKIKVDLANL